MHPALATMSEGIDNVGTYRPEGNGPDSAIPVLETAEFGESLSQITENFHTQIAALKEHFAAHSPYKGFVAGLEDVVNAAMTMHSAAENAWHTHELEEENALNRVRNQEANETGRDVMAHDQ
jgi:hypothetical protein